MLAELQPSLLVLELAKISTNRILRAKLTQDGKRMLETTKARSNLELVRHCPFGLLCDFVIVVSETYKDQNISQFIMAIYSAAQENNSISRISS